MHVTSVQLDVVVKDDSNYSLFMRQATGLFGVSLLANYVKEMERTTKKKPPKTTEVHIMWSNYDEYESSSGIRGKNSMFDDLVPSTAEQGRIFIGFPTHQTTGCSIQIAAHLIPTVERESIDFVDKTLNVWNQELLSTTGLLSRIIYADELTSIQNMYTELPKPLDKEMQKWLNSRAAHAMASFSFRPSTPSALVGRICSAYFIKSAPKNPLEIMSTVGVLPVNQVRLLGSTPNEVLLKSFIKRVPVIPDEILSSCQPLISQLESIGSLVKISFADVLSELEARTLETLEMIQCLKWFIEFRKTSAMTEREFQQFLNSAVITFPSAESSSNNNKEPGEYGVQTSHPPRPLAQIKFFSTSRSIPPNLPLPENCLPLEISKNFTNYELESFFGHLVELSLPDWMEYVSKDPAFTTSPFFSEKLLGVCSRAWGSTSNVDKARIISILTPLACLPTTHGMQKPDDAYFKSVTLFEDIPVVFFPSAVDIKSTKEDGNGGSSSKKPNAVASLFGKMLAGVTAVAASAVGKAPISDVFLKSLGVREHVDLQMVFDRLETLNWDHMQLIKYLASVSAKLSEVEIVRLRVTPLFPKELGVPDAASAAALEKDVGLGNTSSSSSSSSSSKTSSSSTRFKAQDLYSPFDELRTIGGLDLIEWKGKWSKSSEEGK